MTRYQIQYADPAITAWKSCFNGMNIGNGFIAPIVTRETGGLRLRIMESDKGRTAIREVEAYFGTGRTLNDPDGLAATRVIG